MGYNYLTKPAKMEKHHWGECQHIHKISKGGYNLNFDYRRAYQNLDLRFVDIFVPQWEIYYLGKRIKISKLCKFK